MAKLKNIIKQLSESDYQAIHDLLTDSNADKSAFLLQSMRMRNMSDVKIMGELDVNTNAYYTLRSRLNQRIEEYLMQQMESPRTDILKKVANVNEIIFTRKKTIAIATLKKIEKELIEYDLSNELTLVYKVLKKLHIHSPEYFNYSQLYNKHVAYMLSVDKAEDLLADYFKKYGVFILSNNDDDKLGINLVEQEMDNVKNLYDSHRLYVYQSCLSIFHRLFVSEEDETDNTVEPIEDIIENLERIFAQFPQDAIYYHLKNVFEFLKFEYYNHYRLYRKSEEYFDDVNDGIAKLLSNYSLFSFSVKFLMTKIERHLRLGKEAEMYEENIALFEDFEPNQNDVPQYVIYVSYRAVSCYYAGKYDEAARWINNLLNTTTLKKFPLALLELKSFLALQYCLQNDYDLYNQLVNSIQRQIRLLGKENCEDIYFFTKMLKISMSDTQREKHRKITMNIEKFNAASERKFSITRLIKMDEIFIKKLTR